MTERIAGSDLRLFIGLVTHPASAHPKAQTDEGVARQLQVRLAAQGMDVIFSMCNENLLAPEILGFSAREVRESINAELAAEGKWRVYLNSKIWRPRLHLELLVRKTYRHLKLSPPWGNRRSTKSAGANMLRRLANIELAHTSLLQQALDADADWALILEDDAHVENIELTAQTLGDFLVEQRGGEQPRYINVSQSFSQRVLGTKSLGVSIGNWAEGQEILSMEKPVTNTVCAVLYSKTFIPTLLDEFGVIPLSPVLPIDWKLNVALMNLVAAGKLGAGHCWQVDPAPFIQGSMHHVAVNK